MSGKSVVPLCLILCLTLSNAPQCQGWCCSTQFSLIYLTLNSVEQFEAICFGRKYFYYQLEIVVTIKIDSTFFVKCLKTTRELNCKKKSAFFRNVLILRTSPLLACIVISVPFNFGSFGVAGVGAINIGGILGIL